MPRTIHRLTDKIVRNIDAPGYHADGGGLYLQVSKSGSKSWVYRFTLKRRTRDMGLGSALFVNLTEARAKAAEYRMLVTKGIDPIEHAKAGPAETDEPESPKPACPAGPTFREFAEQYIEARADTWRSAKHADQWSATLKLYAYPVIGSMTLDEIDTPDVLRILEPIWNEKSETASRVRGRIERILAAASVRGLRPATNPAAWVGHLREALPPKRKAVAFAALPYSEVPAFLEQLRKREAVGARCLEFTIVTAARSGEARGASWDEMDTEARTWTVPAERMKAGRPHVVPLSDRAVEILETMKPMRDLAVGVVFPGLKGTGLSDMTLSKLVRTMGYDVTVHGFRASFKTWGEEETEHPNVVIEAALAHIVGDKSERSYMRGDWLSKRRALMDDWAAYCTSSPVETVVPLRRKSASA